MEPSAFGSLLKRYRTAAGLTQEELAERARLSTRAISDLERGVRRSPYRDTVQQLADALELDGTERADLRAAARRLSDTVERAVGGAAATPSKPNLPAESTSFIGRQREVEEIAALLVQPAVRLVTLTGPGGIGKTRLALQLAARVLDDRAVGAAVPCPDGVFFVPLASISDPSLVPSAIARVLDLNERGGQGLIQGLIEHFRTRRLLLVLDNFEHLVDARALLQDLLGACPSLRLLVTSRAVLHLSWEHVVEVPPLGLPDPSNAMESGAAAESEAIALFVERARAVKADFALTRDNAEAVVQICRSLDGMPLAIELAAARLRLFPPRALLPRLSQRLQFLTGGPHDLPARHRTLRAAIDWSYSLLGDEEKRLFARLSVFAGGGTLEAIAGVCTRGADRGGEVLDVVASLIEKSLLGRGGEEEPRFVMLETIREYAAERLAEMGDTEQLKEEHAQYYLALAEDAAVALEAPEQGAWVERIEMERDNMRAALLRFERSGDVDRGLRLALALQRFWMVRGPLSEGRQWLAGLASVSEGQPMLRAAAFSAAGKLATMEGRRRESAELFEQSLVLYRQGGDRKGAGQATGWLAATWYLAGDMERAGDLVRRSELEGRESGDQAMLAVALRIRAGVAAGQGDARQTESLGEESLALYRELDDAEGIADVLQILASAAYRAGDIHRARSLTDDLLALLRAFPLDPQKEEWLEPLAYRTRMLGDYAYATRFFEELAARTEAAGDRRLAAHARAGLGLLAREQGDYRRAAALYEESLAVAQEVGDLLGRCRALVGLSDVARDRGDAERVIQLCEESLSLLQETGDAANTGFALHNLGTAAWYQGDHDRAERLFSEALGVFQRLQSSADIVEVLASIGMLALNRGQYERAGEIFAECLVTAQESASRWIVATLLEGMAGVAAGLRQAEHAARLIGAAESARFAIGTPRPPALLALHDRAVAAVVADLGSELYLRVVEQGRGLTLEQAIACALEDVTAS